MTLNSIFNSILFRKFSFYFICSCVLGLIYLLIHFLHHVYQFVEAVNIIKLELKMVKAEIAFMNKQALAKHLKEQIWVLDNILLLKVCLVGLFFAFGFYFISRFSGSGGGGSDGILEISSINSDPWLESYLDNHNTGKIDVSIVKIEEPQVFINSSYRTLADSCPVDKETLPLILRLRKLDPQSDLLELLDWLELLDKIFLFFND